MNTAHLSVTALTLIWGKFSGDSTPSPNHAQLETAAYAAFLWSEEVKSLTFTPDKDGIFWVEGSGGFCFVIDKWGQVLKSEGGAIKPLPGPPRAWVIKYGESTKQR